MNFIKAQIELLKACDKENRKIRCGEWDYEHTAFSINDAYAVIIPNEHFYIDLDKVPSTQFFKNNTIHPTHYNPKPWRTTGIKKTILIKGKKKKTLVELTDTTNFKYVDEKNLKIFNDPHAVLKTTNAKASPIYIYSSLDEVIGLIMPFNINKGGNN